LSEISQENSSPKWKLIETKNAPAPRYGHSGFIHSNFVYIFGGYNKKVEKVFNDMWMLNTDTFAWEKSQLKG
jgi:N-acetylneuraminic acid mutarotase